MARRKFVRGVGFSTKKTGDIRLRMGRRIMSKSPEDLVADVVRDTKCTTCGRSPSSPYRRNDGGKITEGCIDDAHTGHLYGSSLEWHMRPAAKKLRAETKARLKEILKSGRRR